MKKADKIRKWRQTRSRILGILLVLSICASSLNLPMVSASAAILQEEQEAKKDTENGKPAQDSLAPAEETDPEEPGNPPAEENQDVSGKEEKEEGEGTAETPSQEPEDTRPEEEAPADEEPAEEADTPAEDLDTPEERAGGENVSFVFGKIEGGNMSEETPEEEKGRRLMLGHGESNGATFELSAIAQFGSGEAKDVFFTLELPYFYRRDDGILVATYEADEVPEDQRGSMYVGAKVVGDTDGWLVDVAGEYTGKIRFSSRNVLPTGTTQTLKVKIYLHGDIPENTTAPIRMGGGYGSFQDVGVGAGYEISPGETPDSVCVLTCSNLKWETSLEGVEPRNAQWDVYNYLVYRAVIANTSEDDKSHIKSFNLNVRLPAEGDGGKLWGVSDKEAMKWLYNDGNPVKNTGFNPEDREKEFVGVPGEGGALIYDVTELSEEELAKWDLTSFTNARDKEGTVQEPIPYHFTVNGGIYFEWKGELHHSEQRVFYIAVPISGNVPGDEEQEIPAQSYHTIAFGENATWTVQRKCDDHGFEPARMELFREKYVLDDSGNRVKTRKASIGDEVVFYLEDFQNGGNIPLFDSYAEDLIERDFTPVQISVQMDRPEEADREPQLTDWFAGPDAVEFEFAPQGGGDAQYVSLGTLAPDTGKTSESLFVWSMNAEKAIQDYLSGSGKGSTYTGRFRVRFCHRIGPGASLEGRIAVRGRVNSGITYTNKLAMGGETWKWVSEIAGDKGYLKTPHKLEGAAATVVTEPVSPLMSAEAYRIFDDGSMTTGNPLVVPINVEGVGYRYKLGNNSNSKIYPGVFSTEAMAEVKAGRVNGFITRRLVLSKKLAEEKAEIHSVTIYTSSGRKIEILPESFTQDADGNYVLDRALWASGGELLRAEVNFDTFGAKIALSGDVFVALEGHSNIVSASLKKEGTFTTRYADETLNKSVKASAALNVSSIQAVLRGESFMGEKRSATNEAGAKSPQKTVHSLEVPNGKTTGYEFRIANQAVASSGETDLVLDLSDGGRNVGNKGTEDKVHVKGFQTEEIAVSGYEDTVEIREIRIYDWNQDPEKEEARVVIPFDSLKPEDPGPDADPAGRLVIGKDLLANVERVKCVVIACDDFYGCETPDQAEWLRIVVTGNSDWYNELDASMTFRPANETMESVSLKDRLYVAQPRLEVYAHVEYYELQEKAKTETENTDQNEMYLGVPYDRDFTWRVEARNGFTSRLEDVDLIVNLPIRDAAQGEEAHTGFHTTGIQAEKELLEQFGELVSLTLQDVDASRGICFLYDAGEKRFTAEDGSGTFVLDAEGNLTLTEEQLIAWGIPNLKSIIITGKSFAVSAPGETFALRVHGFSDSDFGTEDRVQAWGDNYLGGVRHTALVALRLRNVDHAKAYISKMYFDTMIAAGYKEEGSASGERFDKVAAPEEHIRFNYPYKTGPDVFDDNIELDIGYKAVGSYLIDFRQYVNVGKNYPDLRVGSYYSQEHENMAYVYPQSMNTRAEVRMKTVLPAEAFEAYYLKVDFRVKDYLKEIQVERQDGTVKTIAAADWEENALETDGTGTQFFRVPLLQQEDGGMAIYRAPADYQMINPVVAVTVVLNVNQEACDEAGNASGADYGIWYSDTDASAKYMFEITGRFVKAGAANATVTAKLTAGGTERTGAKAKIRTQQGVKAQDVDTVIRSHWSYYNNYEAWRSGKGTTARFSITYRLARGGKSIPLYCDAGHLSSTVRVQVCGEKNQVKKGVHTDPLTEKDDTVGFGSYQEFAVSFFQEADGKDEDYRGGGEYCFGWLDGTEINDWAYWIDQDPFDWKDKHAFTDKLILEDTLPVIRPDGEDEHYGFVTRDIYLSSKLYPYIDTVEVTVKKVTAVQSGDNVTYKEEILKAPRIIAKADLKESEKEHSGFWHIPVCYSGEEEQEGALVLGENEYIHSYQVILKNLPGDGDYAAELEGMALSEKTFDHDGNQEPDVYVGGEVCILRATPIPEEAWNTMKASSYYDNQEKPWLEISDKGCLLAYRLPFQADFLLTASSVDDANKEHRIYDYQETGDRANLDPNYAAFELRVWNRTDTDQEQGRSACIGNAVLKNTMHQNYRLKHIYIPEAFVEGDWFRVKGLTLRYGTGGKEVFTCTLEELQAGGTYARYMRKEGGQYVFDADLLLRENYKKLEAWNAVNLNNAEPGDTYRKEYIQSFTLELEALNKAEGLKGGEYLNPSRQNRTDLPEALDADPVFSYDGVYADRTEEDIKNNVWTIKSRPTVIHKAFADFRDVNTIPGQDTTQYWNTAEAEFTAIESAAEKYQGHLTEGTVRRDYYRMDNLVSTLLVDLTRGRTLEKEDGSQEFSFAYDGETADGKDRELFTVDREHLLPGDYVEHRLSVGVDADSPIPVYHPDLVFEVPRGQRIVGWYVENQDSGISSEDITVLAGDKTGRTGTVKLAPEKYYGVQKKGLFASLFSGEELEETAFRRLDISVGNPEKAFEENLLKPGKEIVIVAVIQLTEELEAFEGKTLPALFQAAARPTHTYSQYKIQAKDYAEKDGAVTNTLSVQNAYFTDEEEVEYLRYYADPNHTDAMTKMSTWFGSKLNVLRERTYLSEVKSELTFYDSLDLTVNVEYDNDNYHYDSQPVTLTVAGKPGEGEDPGAVCNDTLHSLKEAVYSLSFLSESNGKRYKGFDLTKKPSFPYPDNMAGASGKTAKVEYCFYGAGTEAESYGADEKALWISEDLVIEGEILTEEQKAAGFRLLKDAVGIRWTYENVPAWGTDGEPVCFASAENPFTLHGLGRFRDIRTDGEKEIKGAADRYKIHINAAAELVHEHKEELLNTLPGTEPEEEAVYEFLWETSLLGKAQEKEDIARERPILTLHTQILESEADAESVYDEDAQQKLGYRPGDTAWFKTTVINQELDPADADTGIQGALLEPVIYDKLPEYIAANGMEALVTAGADLSAAWYALSVSGTALGGTGGLQIRWYDREGNLKDKDQIPAYTVTRSEFQDIPDYGGDMVTEKSNTDGCTFGTAGAGSARPPFVHGFADLKLGAGGNTVSMPIDFQVYEIRFAPGSSLEPGERIELFYEVEIREENLPMAYTRRGEKVFPDYYPKMGEYGQVYPKYWSGGTVWNPVDGFYTESQPYIGIMEGKYYVLTQYPTPSWEAYGMRAQFQNAEAMMDMSFLCHDAGVSGTRNPGTDRYEFLKESQVFIPGRGDDHGEVGGSNGYLKDYDINTHYNQQQAGYIPAWTNGKKDELPQSASYNHPVSGKARDWYAGVMKLRGETDWQRSRESGGHNEAVLWAEARLHLQTAWLAASSQLIGESDYLASTEYLPTAYHTEALDPHYDYVPRTHYASASVWEPSDGWFEAYDRKLLNDDSITVLEYDQNFTARIGAYNYGDWDLSEGVEFLYIMPYGVEPDISGIQAKILSGGTSRAPEYQTLDSKDIRVEVLQEPGTWNGYLTPDSMRDPILGSPEMDRAGDNHARSGDYYAQEDSVSWVLKITVSSPLKKWFYRGSESGYMMLVDIPSHVYKTPADEYWYDEVLVRPVNPGQGDSRYYQVYDSTALWGNSDPIGMGKARGDRYALSYQYGGMDWLWNIYQPRSNGGQICAQAYAVNGSPNLPYINGMNISNREVSAQDVLFDSGKENFASGDRSTWASTGSRAHMRKPFLRVWTTIGATDRSGKNINSYYVNPKGERSALNIYVENKYWLNTMAPDQYSRGGYNTGWYSAFINYAVRHKYSTNGGGKGTLYYPVVTDILPPGIVPLALDGAFSEDNEKNASLTLDWTLYGASYSGNTREELHVLNGEDGSENEQALYEAQVEYITLEGENGEPEGRYKITFMQKGGSLAGDKAKIASETERVFSFRFFTAGTPDYGTKDGGTNDELLDQYQKNHVFVSSSLENFKFLIDSESAKTAAENPYWVGSNTVTNYNNFPYGNENWLNGRPDRPSKFNCYPDIRNDRNGTYFPTLPVTATSLMTKTYAIDATEDGGNRRYYETEDGKIELKENYADTRWELDMEDYTSIRWGLRLAAGDTDLNGNGIHGAVSAGLPVPDSGVHTTNRIRIRYPSLENRSFVSESPADGVEDSKLGVRSEKGTEGEYTYYPDDSDKSQAFSYRDRLYYHVKAQSAAAADEYMYHGDINHGRIRMVLVLPKHVTFDFQGTVEADGTLQGGSGDDGALYLMYKKEDGGLARMELSQIEQAGFRLRMEKREINQEGREVLVFDLITPGDYGSGAGKDPNYEDYLDGRKMPGYFGSSEILVLGIRTEISSLEPADTILMGERYWDENYAADTYITLDDLDGAYLNDLYPDGGFDRLEEYSDRQVYYAREETDQEDEGIDLDGDGDYSDRYAHDVTGAVTVLKPHATARLDTSKKRIEITNPDLFGGTARVVEDPAVKGAEQLMIYLDQAVNEGSAVPRFLIDFRIPFRGTDDGTREEAGITDNKVTGRIFAISTGKWEIPESAGDAAYREALKKHLKVHVFVQYSDDLEAEHPLGPADARVSYDNEMDDMLAGTGGWMDLLAYSGKPGGVSIEENYVVNMQPLTAQYDLGRRIYQIRYVIVSDDPAYMVPQGFRLAIDADPSQKGNQEMDEVDPDRENLKDLPDSVVSKLSVDESGSVTVQKKGNAAFVMATVGHEYARKQHVNYFANPWARYDKDQYGRIGERARAGYYVSREMPVLEVDLSAKYLKQGMDDEGKDFIYKWVDDLLISQSSKTLKYKASVWNMSQEAVDKTDLKKGTVVDDATNPQISAVLPFIQDIDSTLDPLDPSKYQNYRYIEYQEAQWEDSYLNPNPDKPWNRPAEQKDAGWTWHIEDEEGNRTEAHQIRGVTLEMYDHVTDINDTGQRRVLTWTADGILKPGQRLVIDFLVPVTTEGAGIGSSGRMNCKAYAFKPGSFVPHIPESSSGAETYSYELDKRDINRNGLVNSENTLVKTLGGIAFNAQESITRTKLSFSEYGTGLNATGNDYTKPSLVPEGSEYSFHSVILNPNTSGTGNGYTQPILYDVLPYADDIRLTTITGQPEKRGSVWRGYVRLSTIAVEVRTGTGDARNLEDGKDVNIWVGPFQMKNGEIVPIDMKNLPKLSLTTSSEFYKSIRGEGEAALREKGKYFVRLSEMLALKDTDPEKYEELERHVQAIYAEPEASFVLGANTKMTLVYRMKAPLNLPLYNGYTPEESLSVKLDAADFSGWNSFVTQTGDLAVQESSNAGVYLDAPADRGYIGYYVWLDDNYSSVFTDEAQYEHRKDGRWILKKKTKDLNEDGKPDDPGINGVKVELLSPAGYPVNQEGEAVAVVDGRYCLVDEATGELLLDTTDKPIYTVYGPEVYITEKDAYGNDGYYVMSNLKPGSYKLRFTFPEKAWDESALTTRILGNAALGGTTTSMKVYRPGDTLPDLGNPGTGAAAGDGEEVHSLVIQTVNAVRVDAIGTNPATYPAYDERMTAYNLGVAPAYIFGGYAWLDEGPDPGRLDGYKQKEEAPIQGLGVTIYQVAPDGRLLPAYDRDGNQISRIQTDKDGYFRTSLYPYRSYVAVAMLERGLYEPSIFNPHDDPLEREDDNDLRYNPDYPEGMRNVTPVFAATKRGQKLTEDKRYYGPFDGLGLGLMRQGKAHIGKYVFEDRDYNGVYGEYINEEGYVVTEPGVDGVKIALEQYGYDEDLKKWILIPGPEDGFFRTAVSEGGSYIFQELPTTVVFDDGIARLAGYRVKADMGTIPEGYAPAKYHMSGRWSDSDLPVQADPGGDTEGYRYLKRYGDVEDRPMPVARKAESEADANFVVEGVAYDTSAGEGILDMNIGLVRVETSQIRGIVWEDKNYDGMNNTYTDADGKEVQEPGIEGIELELLPYYYESGHDTVKGKWVPLKASDVGEEVYRRYTGRAETDEDGGYLFENVPSTVLVQDQRYLCGYQVSVKSDLDALGLAVTRYRSGANATDNTLVRGSGILGGADEYLVPARQVAGSDLIKEYGAPVLGNQAAMLVHNDLGWFDVNKTKNLEAGQGGLRPFDPAEIGGRAWLDKNYNGIMDEKEKGLEDVEIVLSRYYLTKDGDPLKDAEAGTDKAGNTLYWAEDPDFSQTVKTDAGGDYTFADLKTYVYRNGEYCLAGYKTAVKEHPSGTGDYTITLYRQPVKEGQRNSDLKDGNLNEEGEYIVTAREIKNPGKDVFYLLDLDGKTYDLVLGDSWGGFDAGYLEYPDSVIAGCVFDDLNYDGVINEGLDEDGNEQEDSFTEELRKAIKAGPMYEYLEIRATAFYYQDGQWHPYYPDGGTDQAAYSVRVDLKGDGSYKLSVPTQFLVEDQRRLAGYEVEVNKVPAGYHVTRHLGNQGNGNENTLRKIYLADRTSYRLTKTDINGAYKGTLWEEIDGKLVAAGKPVSAEAEGASVNMVDGYDVARDRTLDGYNVGYTGQRSSRIRGYAFKDTNYNGVYGGSAEDYPLSNIKVGLKLFELDAAADEWVERTDLYEPGKNYYQEVQTGDEGGYLFLDLPTHAEHGRDFDGTPKLFGYEVWLAETAKEDGKPLAATYYQADLGKKTGILNSALNGETGQVLKPEPAPGEKDTLNGEIYKGKIVTAVKLEKDDPTLADVVNGYDCAQGTNRINYNLGFVDYRPGSIEGTAFVDRDYDGLYKKGTDDPLENVEIGIRLMHYDKEQDIWDAVAQTDPDGSGDGFVKKIRTDKDGHYRFEDLPVTQKAIEEGDDLYGYGLYVLGETDRYVTRYQMNEGKGDSALLHDTRQIIKISSWPEIAETKAGAGLPEKTVVLGSPVDDSKKGLLNTPYIVLGYDMLRGVKLTDYNVGFTPKDEIYRIGGTVWEDTNYNGILDEEKPVQGIEVTLEKWYFQNDQWTQDAAGTQIAVTDADGTYGFEDLKAVELVNGNLAVCGYKAQVKSLPKGYGVSVFHANKGKEDSDLNDKTGYLEEDGEMLVLADKADESTPDSYKIGGYNISHGHSLEDLNAGLVSFSQGSIRGIAFEDSNNNGVCDAGERIVSNASVYLHISLKKADTGDDGTKDPDGAGAPDMTGVPADSGDPGDPDGAGGSGNPDNPDNPGGSGDPDEPDIPDEVEVRTAVTDSRGRFEFNDLPALDENGELYEYQLYMKKSPEGRFTLAWSLEEAEGKKRNILSDGTIVKMEEDPNMGICPVMYLAEAKDEDFYGVKWKVNGYRYTSSYLGYYLRRPEGGGPEGGPGGGPGSGDGSNTRQADGAKTGDRAWTEFWQVLASVSALGTAGLLMLLRRRRRTGRKD